MDPLTRCLTQKLHSCNQCKIPGIRNWEIFGIFIFLGGGVGDFWHFWNLEILGFGSSNPGIRISKKIVQDLDCKHCLQPQFWSKSSSALIYNHCLQIKVWLRKYKKPILTVTFKLEVSTTPGRELCHNNLTLNRGGIRPSPRQCKDEKSLSRNE